MTILPARRAIAVFLAFAGAYFLSALIRAITATLSPTLTQEFALTAGDLGLLAGAYFAGFAATQLPLGAWLDRHGPRRVILGFLLVAVLGCMAFASARSFTGLIVARALTGVGVSACLMAPLTGYRRWLAAAQQQRANSWMLMTGSLGMLMSTLPVQWLLPLVGWRVLFWGLAVAVLLAMAMIALAAPHWQGAAGVQALGQGSREQIDINNPQGYTAVWRHPYFRRMMPLGFFCYGGLLAVQTLWAVPWMSKVALYSPLQAAQGLFWINVAMLCTFWTWGWLMPRLSRRGWDADFLIIRCLPLSFVLLAAVIIAKDDYPELVAGMLALYCMSCSVIALSQPAVAMAFAPSLAGRALSAFNLVLFVGVFVVQWGIGLLVDVLRGAGVGQTQAYQLAFAAFLGCSVTAYLYFLAPRRHNQLAPSL